MPCISCRLIADISQLRHVRHDQDSHGSFLQCRNAAIPVRDIAVCWRPPASRTARKSWHRAPFALANSSSTMSKSLTDFLRSNQINVECAALLQPAFHVDIASILFDYFFADRQAEPRTSGSRCETGLKNLFQQRRFDSPPIVRELDLRRTSVTIGRPPKPNREDSSTRHGAKAVQREIEKRLLKAVGIGGDGNGANGIFHKAGSCAPALWPKDREIPQYARALDRSEPEGVPYKASHGTGGRC